jgi:hypothetical protein
MYATKQTSAKYTMFNQPSKTNHLVCQWVGAKSGVEAPAKVKLLMKKKPKITMMLVKMHHHNLVHSSFDVLLPFHEVLHCEVEGI